MESWKNPLLVAATITVMLILIGGITWQIFGRRNVDVVATIQIREPQYIVEPEFSREPELDDFVETQQALIKTRAVLDDALEDLSRKGAPLVVDRSDPYEYLEDQIETSMISRELMEIRMPGQESTAKQRREILNEILQSYLSFVATSERQLTAEVIAALIRHRDERQAMLERLRRKLDETKNAEDFDQHEYFFAEQEFDQQLKIYHRISERIVELQTNQAAPSRIELIDAPSIRRRR